MDARVRLGLIALPGLLVVTFMLNGLMGPVQAAHLSHETSHRIISTESIETNLSTLVEMKQVRLHGGWEWAAGSNGLSWGQSRFNDVVIEGTLQGSWLELYTHLNGQDFEVTLDGDGGTPMKLTAPATDQDGYLQVLHNLSAGAHHFIIRLLNRHGGQLLVRSLRTDGNWQVGGTFTRQPRLLGFGSSTMDFCGITWNLSQQLGWEGINRGIGGTTVIHEGQYRVAHDVIPEHPETLLINYGSNDWFENLPVADFQTAYLSMLNQIGNGLPNTKIVVMGLFPRVNGNEQTRPLYNQAIQAAVKASNVADRINYFEVRNYDYLTQSVDGTHPNLTAVHSIFVPELVPLFNGLHPQLDPVGDNY